jgi:hypothetical protein
MKDDKPRQPETTPDGDVFGAPRKFSYPPPLPLTEEERQRYAEAGQQVDEIIAKMKRRRRYRPR